MKETGLIPATPPIVQMVHEGEGDFPEEIKPVNPLVRLQTLLYGRYKYAITLGILLSILGATAAFLFTPTKYEIVGYVRVKPYVAKVLYQSDENGMMPSFDTFVDLQESLLQSERVLDKASQDPDWVALHRPNTSAGASGINIDNLLVDHTKGTELITVTATDRDLNAAMAAVKSILRAYLEISGETEGESDAHRQQLLEDLSTSLSNQVRGIHDQILTIANQYGTDDLSSRHEAKAEEANRLDEQLQQIELSLSLLPSSEQATTGPSTQPAKVSYTREEVALVDRRMAEDLNRDDRLKIELDELSTRMGDNNNQVVAKRLEISKLEQQMDEIVAAHEAEHDLGQAENLHDRGHVSAKDLREQQASVRALYDRAQKEALELGRQDLKLRELKDQQTALNKRQDEASNRIQQLNLEGNVAGRISILSYGEKPTTPLKSKKIPLTIAAGLGGLFGGVGLVALWGFLDTRVRSVLHIKQVEPNTRMLGILPVLPEEIIDPTEQSIAAHCVHQLRNVLDVNVRGGCHTLAITSPSSGSGKTSLTLALGLSFAGTGARTLLVDCDMVGGGLTSRLDSVTRGEPQDLLIREGVLTQKQVEEAQLIADSTSEKLSKVLLALGYITEADVERVSKIANQAEIGLLQALDGEPLKLCVTPVLTKNLSILPLGDAASHHTTQISAKALRMMIDQARSMFDIIIIDTGPILGSLEASIVVREVDDVVLVVTRNEHAPMVRHSIKLLDSLGARLAGLVFNRANAADVDITQYGSSTSAASIRSTTSVRQRTSQPRDASQPVRLGSLVAAVVRPDEEKPKNGTDVHVNGN